MMEFNYLNEKKAVEYASGRYAINYELMPVVIAALAKELLEMEATGDGKRAAAWFAKFDTMPAELTAAIKNVKGVPVDIDPISDWPELPRDLAHR
jgi:hypothetical protein